MLANSNADKFSILSTNIQSINAKFDKLEIFVELLNTMDFKFNIIFLQETWKSNNDGLSQFSLHGYDLIAQGKNCSDKGGLIIYVDNNYNYEEKKIINMYEHSEGLINKITGNNLSKTLAIGNIYRPPRSLNETIINFIEKFTTTLSTLENCSNLIITRDFNITLFK